MKIKTILYGSLISLTVLTIATAMPTPKVIAQARQHLAKNQPQAAVKLLLPLNQDHAAQFLVADIYHRGLMGKPDYQKALHHYHIAYEKGSSAAALRLGRMHLNGEGITRNEGEAIHWYKKSKDLGNRQGELCYYTATNQPFAYTLSQAQQHKDPEALHTVARAYHFGAPGITQDYAKARAYYEQAAGPRGIVMPPMA